MQTDHRKSKEVGCFSGSVNFLQAVCKAVSGKTFVYMNSFVTALVVMQKCLKHYVNPLAYYFL